MGDGLYGVGGESVQWTSRLGSPRGSPEGMRTGGFGGSPPSSPMTTMSTATMTSIRSMASSTADPLLRPMPTSPLDTVGSDRTAGIPWKEAAKPWPLRSMCQMSDYGTIPSGLPLGLTDNEKKLWLAMYVKARELLQTTEGATVRSAVDEAIRAVAEKHSLEFRFGMRWSHSIKTTLAMRQHFRSSDVYS